MTRCCQLLYRVLLGFPATCWCLGVSAFWRLCHCPVLVDLISCLFICVCPFWLWLIWALRFLNFSTACATLSAANFAAASPALSLAFCKACCPAFFCELTKHCRTNPSQVVCDDACTKLVAIHPSSFLGNPNSHQIRRLVHFDERIENFYVFFRNLGNSKNASKPFNSTDLSRLPAIVDFFDSFPVYFFKTDEPRLLDKGIQWR